MLVGISRIFSRISGFVVGFCMEPQIVSLRFLPFAYFCGYVLRIVVLCILAESRYMLHSTRYMIMAEILNVNVNSTVVLRMFRSL